MRDAVGNINSVLVLGGASEIATETVQLLASRRCQLVVLAVRDPEQVSDLLERYRALGMNAEAVAFDGAASATHQQVIDDVFAAHGDIDLVISAFGQPPGEMYVPRGNAPPDATQWSHVGGEFFAQFAHKRRFLRLARLDTPAGKA